MKRFSLLLLTLLVVPMSALAAPPAAVHGLKAFIEDDTVHVEWNAVTGAARYNVYWSTVSILDNDGAYEDFESTKSAVTDHVLTWLPPSGQLYIAVLAENAAGEESTVFVEEVMVPVPSKTTPPHLTDDDDGVEEETATGPVLEVPEEEPTEPPVEDPVEEEPATPPEEEPVAPDDDQKFFRLLSVQSTTATTVQLTFSHPVVLDPAAVAGAFRITDAAGVNLPLTRLTMEDARLTIDTYPQETTIYQLLLGDVLRGKLVEDGKETLLPLDTATMRTLFTGIGGLSSGIAGDVRNLRLRAQPNDQGTYDVEAQWVAPDDLQSVAGYAVSQSIDGGKTTRSTNTVQRGVTGVRVQGVPVGSFTLRVQVIDATGRATNGVTAGLTLLPVKGGQASSQASSIRSASSSSRSSSITQPPKGDNLPQTGGVLLVTATAAMGLCFAPTLRKRLGRSA